MEKRHILIVEDDPQQFSLIEEELHRTLKEIKVNSIQTESEFYSDVDEILRVPPDLILMDMMLRWTDPAPPEEIPEMPHDVKKEGYYRAGIRCTERLLANQPKLDIPILIFTVLGQESLEDDLDSIRDNESVHISYLPKTSRIKELLDEVLRIAPAFKENLKK